MSDAPKSPADYKDTVFLPKTDFPMKAGLPQKEPGILAKWEADGLYHKLREARAGREKFILHDGPPYANGDMHIGHALNHILKDMVCRTQSLLGKDAPYVPGWDCHGLPIEWKVEEQYRKQKRNKDEVPVKEFRAECRAYAQHWVNVQREQVKRLGVLGHWDKPYLTMDFDSEATIVSELLKFAESGQLYRGAKPVMWSPVEKTALAEAEIEYEDITSTQIDVAFEIVESPNCPAIQELLDKGEKIHAVIWTTTPWTIPVNQAIAYGPEVEYRLIELQLALNDKDAEVLWDEKENEFRSRPETSWVGKRVLVAEALQDDFVARLARCYSQLDHDALGIPKGDVTHDDMIFSGTEHHFVEMKYKGSDLAGTIARHPMHHFGGFFAKPRPFLPGDFVTTDSGTGLVHMAPDHGEDDFDLCKAHGIEPVFAVEGDGKYRADWGWLGGQGSVINKAFNSFEGPILQDLHATGALLAHGDFNHSYPHSWRSKAKVIYRCTPQWFVPMGAEGGLRDKALTEIARVRWVPEKGQNRIRSMVEGRPDWVLSRQRAWGVPITLFVDRKTGQYLNDPAVNARIVAAVREEGVDAWDASRAQDYLGSAYNAEDYEQVFDILDVWFDSGCTHVFTLESGKWPELSWPADLYLEGSDQHRGWFQSSLLQSCGTRGRAPYDAVLTHGFTMDAKGMKMSKSLGNTIDPLKVMETSGADIIRLWALSVDFTEDHRIGDEILKGVGDQYRKLRNTFRYLLGALEGFSEDERVDVADMPELERYMLHLLADMDAKLKHAVDDFDFNSYVRLLSDFCNEDLSAFFFDIRKDCLYCDVNPASGYQTDKRRAYRTVLDTLFHALVRYASPVLVFTAEEVWGTRFPDAGSVHLGELRDLDSAWLNRELAQKWELLREFRSVAFAAAENARREKVIGSSLEARITLVPSNSFPLTDILAAIDNDVEKISELFISGTVLVTQGNPFELREAAWSADDRFGAVAHKTNDHKCGRCWRHLPEVAEDGALCGRCETVLAQ